MAHVVIAGHQYYPVPVSGKEYVGESGQEIERFIILLLKRRIAGSVMAVDTINDVAAYDRNIWRRNSVANISISVKAQGFQQRPGRQLAPCVPVQIRDMQERNHMWLKVRC